MPVVLVIYLYIRNCGSLFTYIFDGGWQDDGKGYIII